MYRKYILLTSRAYCKTRSLHWHIIVAIYKFYTEYYVIFYVHKYYSRMYNRNKTETTANIFQKLAADIRIFERIFF